MDEEIYLFMLMTILDTYRKSCLPSYLKLRYLLAFRESQLEKEVQTHDKWLPKGENEMTPFGEQPEIGRRKFQAWEVYSLLGIKM